MKSKSYQAPSNLLVPAVSAAASKSPSSNNSNNSTMVAASSSSQQQSQQQQQQSSQTLPRDDVSLSSTFTRDRPYYASKPETPEEGGDSFGCLDPDDVDDACCDPVDVDGDHDYCCDGDATSTAAESSLDESACLPIERVTSAQNEAEEPLPLEREAEQDSKEAAASTPASLPINNTQQDYYAPRTHTRSSGSSSSCGGSYHGVSEDELTYHSKELKPHGASSRRRSRSVWPPPRPSTVQFEPAALNQVHEADWIWSPAEIEARWYQPADYKQFKVHVIQIIKAVLKAQGKRTKAAQQDANCQEEPFTYSGVIERTYNACFQMELETKLNIFTKHEMSQLKRLYKTTLDAECVLGLERLLVQRIGQDRSELRGSLFGIIQDLQDTPWPHPEVLATNIFQISQEVSRPARLFARHLAQAQWLAACKEDKSHSSSSSSKSKKNSSSSSKHRKSKSPQQQQQQQETLPLASPKERRHSN